MSKSESPHPIRTKADGIPMHYRLQQEIRRGIESGLWAPGTVIPTERKMALDYGVSLGTVRTAILNLVSEGLIYRIQGKGTLVAGTRMIRENIRYYRFVADFGRKEAVPRLKFLDLQMVSGRSDINRHLKIRGGEKIYCLQRLVLISDKPVVYALSYLPCKLFAGLEGFPHSRFEKVPLYLSLEDQFGLPTLSNSELISIESADAETAALLGVPQGTPVLAIGMLSFTYRNRPYEYRISYCLAGGHKILRNY